LIAIPIPHSASNKPILKTYAFNANPTQSCP
jgi:hypothetical protein